MMLVGRRRGVAAGWSLCVLAIVATSCRAARSETLDGGAIFQAQCAVCHQKHGQGLPGRFPPLARNADLFLSRDFPAHVVLFGLTGKIVVNGKTIDSTMPPLDFLSDAQIAAVLGYVRQSFGNAELAPKAMPPLDAAGVAAVRAKRLASSELVYDERKRLHGAVPASDGKP